MKTNNKTILAFIISTALIIASYLFGYYRACLNRDRDLTAFWFVTSAMYLEQAHNMKVDQNYKQDVENTAQTHFENSIKEILKEDSSNDMTIKVFLEKAFLNKSNLNNRILIPQSQVLNEYFLKHPEITLTPTTKKFLNYYSSIR